MVKGKPSPEQIIAGLGKRPLYGAGKDTKPDDVDDFTWDIVKELRKHRIPSPFERSNQSGMPAVNSKEDLT